MNPQIIRAKPNPIGKDKFGNLSVQVQLAAEWIDIANKGIDPLQINNLRLYHMTFSEYCVKLNYEQVLSFKGILKSGEVIRIHSGGVLPLNQLYAEDIRGADYHLFTGKNYIWNNRCGDSPTLYNYITETIIDKADYFANPPEGKILVRVGNLLI